MFTLVSVQGLTLFLLPVMFRTFGRTFGLSLGQEGQIQSFFYLGAMIALFSAGWITERLGVKRSSLVVFALIGAGSLTLALSQTYAIAKVGATVIGIGNQWVLAISSAIIAARFGHIRQKMYMWVMAVMSATASVGPVTLGYLLTRVDNWRMIFFSLAAALGLAGLALRRISGAELDAITTGEGSSALSGRQLLSSPILWLIGFLVILDNLASGNLLAWTPRLFQLRHGADETRAGLLLTANTVGMLVGRILMGAFVSSKVSERILLGGCYAAGMVAYAVLLWVPSYPVGIAMMALQGAFLSAQAPTTYSLATHKFPARAAVAVPLVDAIGSIGGFSGPALLGWSAEHVGDLGTVMWIIPCMGLCLAAISLGWEYYDRWAGKRNSAPPAASAIGT